MPSERRSPYPKLSNLMQAFAAAPPEKFTVLQPETTYSGTPIRALPKGLPKTTQSLCPECGTTDSGPDLRRCRPRNHGESRAPSTASFATSSIPTRLYLKMEKWTFGDKRGVANPAVNDATGLPGRVRSLLHAHQPHRPRERRPDQPLQPDLPGLLRQRERRRLPLRTRLETGPCDAPGAPDEKPVVGPHRAVLRRRADHLPAFLRALRHGERDGLLPHTGRHQRNPVRRPGVCRAGKEAGLHTLYLQFDGVTDDVYLRTRGQRSGGNETEVHRKRPQSRA